MTFQMYHLYYNWNRTIRIPTLLMYASTLAKLTGHRQPVREDENEEEVACADQQHPTVPGFERAPHGGTIESSRAD